MALCLLLEDETLSHEQQTQVTFVRSSDESLSTLVNDRLDLAKIEAGKTTVYAGDFTVADLFAALRGTLRPLLPRDSAVALVFEDASALTGYGREEDSCLCKEVGVEANLIKPMDPCGLQKLLASVGADGQGS